jgi:hypothetical protein
VPREVEEFAIEVRGEPARDLVLVALQRLREPRQLVARERQLLGIHPHRIDRRRHRERFAVAVGDRAARRGDLGHAREARIALPGEELVILELQLDGAPHQAERAAHQQREHEVRAPAKAARIVARGGASARATPRLAALAGDMTLHGDTSSMSFGGGIAILSLARPRFRRTRASTRRSARAAAGPTRSRDCRADVEPLELDEQLARAMLE